MSRKAEKELAQYGGFLHKLFNDVRFFVFLMTVIIGALFFVVNPDTQLRERLIRIEDKLNTIETNHLPHIQEGVDRNTKQIEANQEAIIGLLLEVQTLKAKSLEP